MDTGGHPWVFIPHIIPTGIGLHTTSTHDLKTLDLPQAVWINHPESPTKAAA